MHAARRKAAARRDLLAALAAVGPSVAHLRLRGRWETPPNLSLADLLEPLMPRCRLLEAEDCFDGRLLAALMRDCWPALREIRLTGCGRRACCACTGLQADAEHCVADVLLHMTACCRRPCAARRRVQVRALGGRRAHAAAAAQHVPVPAAAARAGRNHPV